MELLPKPLEQINEEEWKDLLHRLRLHTWKRYRWLNKVTGFDLDDLVEQAVLEVISGRRRWPPIDKETNKVREDISFFAFLCMVVKSVAAHQWEQEKKKLPMEPFDYFGELETLYITSLESNLIDSIDYTRLTKKILEIVNEDIELKSIMQLWREQPMLKPSEIAEYLSITMPQMRAAQKRLRRKLNEIRWRN